MDSTVPHITHQALHPDPSTSEWGPEEFEEGLWVDYISLANFQTSLVNATPHPAKDPKLNVQSSAWQDRAVASRCSRHAKLEGRGLTLKLQGCWDLAA